MKKRANPKWVGSLFFDITILVVGNIQTPH